MTERESEAMKGFLQEFGTTTRTVWELREAVENSPDEIVQRLEAFRRERYACAERTEKVLVEMRERIRKGLVVSIGMLESWGDSGDFSDTVRRRVVIHHQSGDISDADMVCFIERIENAKLKEEK